MNIKLSLLILLCCCFGHQLSAQQNTILIIADDVSSDYFGCFSTTTDTAKTPTISNLAQKGIRFTKVWSSPLCSITRAGIFTGRYPFRTGVGQVITTATTPQLDTAEVGIAELLQDYAPTKYNTGCAGKWHLHINTPPNRLNPNRMGFDFYSGNFNGQISDYFTYPIIVNGIQDTVNTYATTQTVNDAIAWMDTMNTNKPFFLWLAFNAPHTPFHKPPSNLCDTTGLTGTAAHITANPTLYFKAAIEAMDTEIGRLFQYLNANNLMDSTNIIFIGDNGNTSQVAQITATNKAKGTIYDYGVHVPMIISGPAVVNPNRICDELINTPDLFATIAELCGFQNWKNFIPTSNIIDSRSFKHIIQNQNGPNRTWIFTEQFQATPVASDGKTIRNNDYHLLRFDNGNEAMYNLTTDPEENVNILITAMTATDLSNYHFLCDSITALVGTGTCQPLQTSALNPNKTIQFVPNPTNHILSIIDPEQACKNPKIYTISGESMPIQFVQNQAIISSLPKGIYFVKFTYREAEFVTKFIKE